MLQERLLLLKGIKKGLTKEMAFELSPKADRIYGLLVVRQSCALQDVVNTVSLLTDCRAPLPHNCKTRNYP